MLCQQDIFVDLTFKCQKMQKMHDLGDETRSTQMFWSNANLKILLQSTLFKTKFYNINIYFDNV